MIELGTGDDARFCCIVLHGLGASGHDLAPLAPGLWPDPKVRWVFPHAPERPISINGGMSMRGWYDVRAMDLREDEDEQGVRESADIVNNLIEGEMRRGLRRQDIVVLGFSQGGAMALFAGLRQPEPLRAIVGLSCYLPLAETLDDEIGKGAAGTPVFLGCGAMDMVIPKDATQQTHDRLKGAGIDVELRVHPHLGHGIDPLEMGEVAPFLSRGN